MFTNNKTKTPNVLVYANANEHYLPPFLLIYIPRIILPIEPEIRGSKAIISFSVPYNYKFIYNIYYY